MRIWISYVRAVCSKRFELQSRYDIWQRTIAAHNCAPFWQRFWKRIRSECGVSDLLILGGSSCEQTRREGRRAVPPRPAGSLGPFMDWTPVPSASGQDSCCVPCCPLGWFFFFVFFFLFGPGQKAAAQSQCTGCTNECHFFSSAQRTVLVCFCSRPFPFCLC